MANQAERFAARSLGGRNAAANLSAEQRAERARLAGESSTRVRLGRMNTEALRRSLEVHERRAAAIRVELKSRDA